MHNKSNRNDTKSQRDQMETFQVIHLYLGHFVEAKGNLNTSKQFLCDFFFSLSLKVLKYEDEVYGI